MGLDPMQVLTWVIEPTLQYLDPEIPNSDSAKMLLLLTAAHESHFRYLDQMDAGKPDPGPAYGIWQMEARTLASHHLWLHDSPTLDVKVRGLMSGWPPTPMQLHGNLFYACAMARVHYRRAPERLPNPTDLDGIAALWKRRYNTIAGKGTVAQFCASARAIGWPFSTEV